MFVLITGAAGGLGRAFAAECAMRGYDLLLTDLNEEGLEKVKQGITRQYDVKVLIKGCDITQDSDVDKLIEFAAENGVKLGMLLNVAGLDYEGGFTQRSFEQVSNILRVNIEATLRITHRALSLKRDDGFFYIVFVSSLASQYPMPLKATYAASKRFLLDFSIALGQELKARNVKVLSLCPAGLPTTSECLDGIAAQGFWGSVTTNKLEKVVRRTISRSLQGRKLYIPGAVNRAFSIVGRFLPQTFIASLIFKRWSDAQKRWLVIEKT